MCITVMSDKERCETALGAEFEKKFKEMNIEINIEVEKEMGSRKVVIINDFEVDKTTAYIRNAIEKTIEQGGYTYGRIIVQELVT